MQPSTKTTAVQDMAGEDVGDKPMPLAAEIEAYTDEELDRYLVENSRMVSVQDPENISHEFIQRLRDIVRRENEVKSRVVDLDEVAARLQNLPSDGERFNRSPSLATTASLPPQEEVDQENLRKEIESFHALIEDGSCAPCPFHLLHDFFWNPEQFKEHDEYRDIISFWQDPVWFHRDDTCFCTSHLWRWRIFRKVQRIIRERRVKAEWTLIEEAKHESREDFERIFGHLFGPNEEKWGFSDYAERIKKRLAKYGFNRPFQLNQDLEQQDRLTTWIEYLGYEYFYYDCSAIYLARNQRRHDDLWNELVETNLLSPGETYDSVLDIETSWRHVGEREKAEKDEASAAAAVSATEKAIEESQGPGEALQKRLLEETSALSAAKERLKTIEMRNEAIVDFAVSIRRYRNERSDSYHYQKLLRWIEQQIPLIEREQNSLNNAEEGSDRKNSRSQLKRSRPDEPDQEQRQTECNDKSPAGQTQSPSAQSPTQEIHKRSRDSSVDGRSRKRLKSGRDGLACDDSTLGVSASATSAPTADKGTNQELDSSSVAPSKSLEELKPLRRSARIAAKKEAAAALIAQTPTRDSHRLSRNEGGTRSRPPAKKPAPARRDRRKKRSNSSDPPAPARKVTRRRRRNKA